jgi:hypothetical protein
MVELFLHFFMALCLMNTMFCDIAPCGLLKVSRADVSAEHIATISGKMPERKQMAALARLSTD